MLTFEWHVPFSTAHPFPTCLATPKVYAYSVVFARVKMSRKLTLMHLGSKDDIMGETTS